MTDYNITAKRNYIKQNLLAFIEACEKDAYEGIEDGFAYTKEHYESFCDKDFNADIEAAVDNLMTLTPRDFTAYSPSLHSGKPVYKGILLGECLQQAGNANLKNLSEDRKCDFGRMIPEEVYTWAEQIRTSAYGDLLANVIDLRDSDFDENGCLQSLPFNYALMRFVFITDQFEFKAAEVCSVYLEIPQGEDIAEIELYRRFSVDDHPDYSSLEEFLQEIVEL